jgi:hypothetical protein
MEKLFSNLLLMMVMTVTAWGESKQLGNLTADNVESEIKKQAAIDGVWTVKLSKTEDGKYLALMFDLSSDAHASAYIMARCDKNTSEVEGLLLMVLAINERGENKQKEFLREIGSAVLLAGSLAVSDFRNDQTAQDEFLRTVGPLNNEIFTSEEQYVVQSPDGKTYFAASMVEAGNYRLTVQK